LRVLGAQLGRPIYWAGPRNGVTYEFTETADKRTYVRYLPAGVSAGSPKSFLTVATYPVGNAFAVTSTAARRTGSVRLPVGGGGVACYSASRPTNVYVAFPGSNVQLEIFDPASAALHKLVAAGSIRKVSAEANVATVETKAGVTSPAGLKKRSAKSGHPIFWVGPVSGSRLELSRSPDGRVYVRYLPAGARVGSPKPYLTVGTYPLANGLAVTTAASKKAGAVALPLGNGAVAFYQRTRPTNVYVAFPGVADQVEVFDPSAQQARPIVAEHAVQPVSLNQAFRLGLAMSLIVPWVVFPLFFAGFVRLRVLLEQAAGRRLPGALVLPTASPS
jgi:hypothetical protein